MKMGAEKKQGDTTAREGAIQRCVNRKAVKSIKAPYPDVNDFDDHGERVSTFRKETANL
jgi:hypothetical protein